MAHAPEDTRSGRRGTSAPGGQPTGFAGADYLRWYELPPQETEQGCRTWYARGQNFVLSYSTMSDGYAFDRTDHPDEYMIILPDEGTSATVAAGDETVTARAHTLTVVPPGPSSVRVTGAGRLIRLFSTAAEDLAAKAGNAGSYRVAHPHVTPLQPWPAPPAGYRIRSYSLDVPTVGKQAFRLYRCTNLMVNYMNARSGPRNPAKLSPHHHDDFEQCSLVIDGTFVHHLRWPWTRDSTQWREDEHEVCAAPSVTVIPPPAVHTSEATGEGQNWIIDIFSPPRRDFSEMPGWVLNAEDYPMPE